MILVFPFKVVNYTLHPKKWKVWLLDPYTRYPMGDVTIRLKLLDQFARAYIRVLRAVNPLRCGLVRINLYNYYGTGEILYVCIPAAPLWKVDPSEGSWFIFLLCRLEGRPITFETPGYYRWMLLYMCTPPYATGPTETGYVDPFSGPVDP